MSLHGRPQGEFPPWGGGAQRQGSHMSPHGRPKVDCPPWGDGAQRQGAT
jgi:hypothetical protein